MLYPSGVRNRNLTVEIEYPSSLLRFLEESDLFDLFKENEEIITVILNFARDYHQYATDEQLAYAIEAAIRNIGLGNIIGMMHGEITQIKKVIINAGKELINSIGENVILSPLEIKAIKVSPDHRYVLLRFSDKTK